MSNYPVTVEIPELDIAERHPIFVEGLKYVGLELDDLTSLQRRVLIALQEPEVHLLNRRELAAEMGVAYQTLARHFTCPGFAKLYLYMQNIVLMEHLPEIDKRTMEAAKSEEGTYHDRELAYTRLGVFTGKKAGLTVNINQGDQGGRPDDPDRISPADALVRRFKTLGGSSGGGKKVIVQTPDSDRPDLRLPPDRGNPDSDRVPL